MRAKISRVALILYAILLFLSGLLLCPPGGLVEWFVIMGMFAIPAIIAGPKKYRILGLIALILAVAFTAIDYESGKRLQARMECLRIRAAEQLEQQSGEPATPPNSEPPARLPQG